jgi:hypothetical protein
MIVPVECRRYTDLHRPGGDYALDVAADFAMIEPYLPARVESILDIGCGMCGIDVFLRRKYPLARLELLDSDGDKPFYGHGAECWPYGNRRAAEALLAANGAGKVDRWHDVGTRETLRADLVVSLLSWGFHYPLSSYRVEGFCVADIRHGRGEGPRGALIWAAKKSDRCAWLEC